MGRRVDVDQLVGSAEIARRLGVAGVQTVAEWRRRHADFPPPVVTIGPVAVWVWPDVEQWAKATGRLRRGQP